MQVQTPVPPVFAPEGRARPLRVLFVVNVFPAASETFVIDQIAGLRDRGADVVVATFNSGDPAAVSQKYFDYAMNDSCLSLEYPVSRIARLARALPTAMALGVRRPRVLLRALNFIRYGRRAVGLELVYRARALAALVPEIDVIHCHFGTTAREFVAIREVLDLRAPLVTSFYGFDVSKVLRENGPAYYDELRDACSIYLVMSEDMKRRVVANGFLSEQVHVHPVSVDVDGYPFTARVVAPDETFRILAVGRLVEKKGLDDLLRALAIVKDGTARPVACTIVGGGPLESELRQLAATLGLADVVTFTGFLPIEQVLRLMADAHILVQPSKQAADGDME